MGKKSLKSFLLTAIATVFAVGVVVLLVWFAVILPIRNANFGGGRDDFINFHEFFELDPKVASIVFDGKLLNIAHAPFIESIIGSMEVVYVPASFLQAYVDPFLFWDNSAGVFFASTRYHMLEFVPSAATFLINGERQALGAPLMKIDGEVFLPASLVEGLYALVITYLQEYNIVLIEDAALAHGVANVTVSSTAIRVSPDSRAQIIETLQQGATITINPHQPQAVSRCSITAAGVQQPILSPTSAFIRVRTQNGILGYVLQTDIHTTYIAHTHDIGQRPTILGYHIDNMQQHPPTWDGTPINLVWDVVYHRDANALRMQIPLHPSVNVISPTWFRFDAENLRLSSVASRPYVDWAHASGAQVWPLVFDISQPIARAILMNYQARRNVIAQLVEYVQHYNLDGINIDIEHLFAAEEGPYKIQFLRELAIPMRELGVVLSADVKVPMDWSRFYRRYLIGLTVDFVVLMAYDEHWATSPVSGPVASLGWVNRGVINMLQEVPASQLVLGLPFYNRIWREDQLAGTTTSRAWGMDATRNWFEERDVYWQWDATVGSYYGNVTVMEDGRAITHRVWRECESSITAKMQIFVTHGLAGVAGWQRGLENQGTQNAIAHFF